MSQTKYPLSKELRMYCISIVRNYDRMALRYREQCHDIAYGSPALSDGQPKGNGIGDSTFRKAKTLAELDESPYVLMMKAVEQAKLYIGNDIVNDMERQKLTEAIWDSCIEGRSFVFEYRALCVSRTDFYERRRKFLYDIAKKLRII